MSKLQANCISLARGRSLATVASLGTESCVDRHTQFVECGIGLTRMAKAKEFIVTIADKPGALGKCFLALAERGFNIFAPDRHVSLLEGPWSVRMQQLEPWPDTNRG